MCPFCISFRDEIESDLRKSLSEQSSLLTEDEFNKLVNFRMSDFGKRLARLMIAGEKEL